MYSGNNKKIAKNTIILYFRMMVMMIVSLYTSRVVLASLGIEDFGIYNVVGGIVACLGFLNGTLSTSSSRYITVALGRDQLEDMKKTFSSVMLVNFVLCVIVVLLSESIGLWFFLNKLTIPENRTVAAAWVYQISIATLILNILSVPYNATIIAHEKMSAFAYISLFDAFAKLGVAYAIATSNSTDRLILYAALIFLIQLTDRIIYSRYCFTHFHETHFNLEVDKKLLKNMLSFISWSSYGSLVSVGFTQGLNILLNMFFGPAVNAARGVAVQVQMNINTFVTNFQTAINPQITKSVAVESFSNTQQLLSTSSKFSFFLICILGLPIYTNADYILHLWLKEVPNHTVLFVQLMILVGLFQTLANPIRIVNQAEGNIKKFQLCECTLLAMIVPASYLALKSGAAPESVFFIQLFIEIIAQFIRIKIVLPKIRMEIKRYMADVYYRIIPVFLVPLCIYYCLLLRFTQPTFSFFVLNSIVIELCICMCIILFGATKEEKNMITNFVKSKLRK